MLRECHDGPARRCSAQVLRECHDGPLGTSGEPRRGRWCGASPSGWAKTSTSPCTCARARPASAPRRSTAARAGSNIPSAVAVRWDDWGGLDRRAADDGRRLRHIQNHVDLLSGKVHAVPTRSTATATDAEAIIRDMCLRSGAGFPDVLVVDHDAKFTSEVLPWSRAWALASSSARPITRTPTPRSSAQTAARLRQWLQGRVGQSPHARRVCHHQYGLPPS